MLSYLELKPLEQIEHILEIDVILVILHHYLQLGVSKTKTAHPLREFPILLCVEILKCIRFYLYISNAHSLS